MSLHPTHLPRWLFSWILLGVPAAFAGHPDVIKASHNDVSPPLSQMVASAVANAGGNSGQAPTARATGALISSAKADPVAAPLGGPLTGVTVLTGFDGQSEQYDESGQT